MGRKLRELPEQPSPLVELARWLREQRQRTGLTYAQLAERLEVNKSTLSRAVSGTTLPSLKMVEEIARACGADVNMRQTTTSKRTVGAQNQADAPG